MLKIVSTKAIPTLTMAILLQACSSGSDGEGGAISIGNSVDDNTTPAEASVPEEATTANIPVIDTPEFALGVISESNAESITRSLAKLNKYWLEEFIYEVKEQDFDRGQSIEEATFQNGTSDFSQECIRGGSGSIVFSGGKTYMDENGSRVHVAGDGLSISFEQCGLSYLTSNYYINGTYGFEVESGIYDGYQYLQGGTSVRKFYYNKSISSGGSSVVEYQQGEMNFALNNTNQLGVSGGLFAEKVSSSRLDTAYQLHNFEFLLNRDPGKYSWDSIFYLNHDEEFEIDLLSMEKRFKIAVTSRLEYVDYSKTVTGGLVQVGGLDSQMQIEYFDTYLTYRVDSDNNGDYEIESTLLYSSL